MPDAFPSFEVVAGIGLVVLLLRTIQTSFRRIDIADTNRLLIGLLEEHSADRALKLARSVDVPFTLMARKALIAGEQRRGDDPGRVRAAAAGAFDAEHIRHARRVGTRRSRDLVVLALLVGAVVYAFSLEERPSAVFLVLSAAVALLLIRSIVVQNSIANESRAARDALIDAIVDATAASPAAGEPEAPLDSVTQNDEPSSTSLELDGSGVGPCDRCDGADLILIPDPDRAGIHLGPLDVPGPIVVCRACGHTTLRVENASRVPIGESRGTLRVDADASDYETGVD